MDSEEDERPVTCLICEKKMYYLGHPKHEAEFNVDKDFLTNSRIGGNYYVHARCYRERQDELQIINRSW